MHILHGGHRDYPVVEVIVEPQEMVLVTRVILVDVLEKLDFVKTLIKEVFIILDYLHAHIHTCVQIVGLYGFAEGGGTQILSHMISTSNDCIDYNWKLLVFLKPSPANQSTQN